MQTTDMAVPTAEAKSKLLSLCEHYRKQGFYAEEIESHLWEFGVFISERLPDFVTPRELYDFCMFRVVDISQGMCRLTAKPIEGELAKIKIIAFMLESEIPRIAQAIFPDSFAKGVQEAQLDAMKRANVRFENL